MIHSLISRGIVAEGCVYREVQGILVSIVNDSAVDDFFTDSTFVTYNLKTFYKPVFNVLKIDVFFYFHPFC